MAKCEICEREVELLTIHHLIPRQEKGSRAATVMVCSACHRQLHHLFSNKTLARELNSIEKIRQHPEMQKFIRWVRKQDPHKRIKVRSARSMKK